jgi:two-component system, LytTR family, response regulator
VIRTLIVEDVPLARAGLCRLLAAHDDVEVIAEASTLQDGLAKVEAMRPDLAFLDVELPDGTGLMLAERLREPRPALVYLTAFPEHALPAFGVAAIDYLLKPATSADVDRALARVRRLLHPPAIEAAVPAHLEIRDGGRTIFVALDAIERVDAAGHYLCIHAGGDVHLLRTPITDLLDRLGPAFVRVHRSALIRVDRIAAIADRRNGDGDIRLSNGAIVPLSRSYRSMLEARLAAARR